LVPASIHAEKGERGGRELREREEEGEARDGGCGGDFAGTGSGWKMAASASIARSGWKMDWGSLAHIFPSPLFSLLFFHFFPTVGLYFPATVAKRLTHLNSI
jgi:hypothetical protein